VIISAVLIYSAFSKSLEVLVEGSSDQYFTILNCRLDGQIFGSEFGIVKTLFISRLKPMTSIGFNLFD